MECEYVLYILPFRYTSRGRGIKGRVSVYQRGSPKLIRCHISWSRVPHRRLAGYTGRVQSGQEFRHRVCAPLGCDRGRGDRDTEGDGGEYAAGCMDVPSPPHSGRRSC